MHFLRNLALVALSSTGAHSLATAPISGNDLLLARSISPLDGRDFDTAKGVVDDIAAGFGAVKDAADAFDGSNAAPLKAAAQNLLDQIDSDIVTLQNMTPLTFDDCYYLVTPLKRLQKQADAVEATFKARQGEVKAAGECAAVRDFLSQGVQKSTVVISTIKGKSPDNAKAIVQQQGDKLIQQLQDLRDFYGEANC